MTFFSTPWSVFGACLVFVVGAIIAFGLRRAFNCTSGRSLALYLWHSLFCVIYADYVIDNGGDALSYYYESLQNNIDFEWGTRGVEILTSFFTQGVGLSYLGTFLAFQIFGFIGLLAFDAALREVTRNKSRQIRQLATLIVFLPSISFWSSAIGKDSLSFMAMGLALWAALNFKRRVLLMIVAVLVMLFVRPHMAGMMVIGLSGSFVFQRRVSLGQRLFFGAVALAATVVLVPLGLNYSGVGEDASSAEVMAYIEGRQGENQDGGSSLDIAGMSLPVQLFTYLFRPLPFEAHSLFAMLGSIDNVILLFLFVVGIRSAVKKRLPADLAEHNRIFLWIYCLLAWAILGMTTANLGIAMRQKWMFAPMLIFLLISLIGNSKTVKVK
ncbi:hypothetical protein [Oceanisphaera sp. IT1-181]|uniref:hypothetical protein n=1 Tax=Oceanisphaera sp. IT1-181 TaxID=3081199 RepID=UPI0029CA90A2|nr:hypothetical protein [Oceanisphaera sp. IT1-181]